MNTVYLRRRRKVLVPPRGPHQAPIAVLASLQKDLGGLGFALSKDLLDLVGSWDYVQIASFYADLIADVRAMVGAHRVYTPLYPDFPKQVMEASEAELYFKAFLHYWTLERPNTAASPRPGLGESPPPKLISIGDMQDFEAIFTSLLRSKVAFAAQDKEDLVWFVKRLGNDLVRLLPAQIPCKENLAVLGAAMLTHTTVGAAILDAHVRTATDVLRIAVALSDGDVSLATPCKFRSVTRAQRRLLLGWMERAGNRLEDMWRWRGRWVRLGERLHPSEFASRFPGTLAAFQAVRNGDSGGTFNAKVELSLEQHDTETALGLLATRPGELARRLDHLLRLSDAPMKIVDRFAERSDKVSTPVLLQVLTHFRRRGEPTEKRVFFPKGQVGNLFVIDNKLPALEPATVQALVRATESALLTRFAMLPQLGKCFLDDKLSDYLVPFAIRSASKALRTLVRGSRLPFPAGKGSTLRFFVWWKNGRTRVDIDLSAVMYSGDFRFVDQLSYTNLRSFGGVHSGDIVDAPEGAAEFIDVDPKLCTERGVRYVVMSINSYTTQPFCDLPECFAGWMLRKEAGSGEIFEAKTVVDRVDIASATQICLPAIFDMEKREVVWADIALARHPNYVNNVQNNQVGVAMMLRSLVETRKMNLHDLFALHVKARGKLVQDRADADTVFAVQEGDASIGPFDLTKIASEFM